MTTNEFQTPADIANRGLQIVGARRITALTDSSKNAAAVNFVYDKLRRAELRRNNWRFAIRWATLRPIDTTTFLVVPAQWSAAQSYQAGAVVQDANGDNWISGLAFNVGNVPGATSAWDVYYGPMTAVPWDTTGNTGYAIGEFVYENPAPGVFNIFTALTQTFNNPTTANPDPGVVSTYSTTITYNKGNTVLWTDGFYYMSLIDNNLNNAPATYLMWNAFTSYSTNDLVSGSDGKIYVSGVNSNVGNDPTVDSGAHWTPTGSLQPWTAQFVGNLSANGWQRQIATLADLNIIYPIGAGPATQTTTRNVFRLPYGYMRIAPQDPKAGIVPWLGAPVGNLPNDYLLQGNYLTSMTNVPINLRFSADVTYVVSMDPMFCEGLACRIAMGVCEELTQSADKMKMIASEYQRFMDDARVANGIELGTTEPDQDEWISVRV
jgi:hypothetical protein